MDIKSGFRISIILRVIGVFFFATAPYISYADLLPFVQPEKDEKTGSIAGVIEPPDSNAVVIARRRGSNHGGAAQISLEDGSYRISSLIGGTYDLMLLCHETDYYSIIGQEVDSPFLGKEPNSPIAADANELRLLLDRLSEVYSNAYTKKNLAGIASSFLFPKSYVDYEEKVDYPAIFPKIEKWFNTPDNNILRVTQKRKIWLMGGNRRKAYIICNLVEEIAMTMTRKGVEYFRIDSYAWDELIYFAKEDNAWKVLSKRPINDRIIVYTNAPPNIYSGYLKYVVRGPLVGIEVIPATDNSGNNYVLPPILDKDKSREYPYKFEITPDPRKMKKTAPDNAEEGRVDPLCELSGVFYKGEKTVVPYYLVLDGSNERCYLRGRLLQGLKRGTRIYVRGVLRTYLFEHLPGPNAPPPFRKGWIIYMDVKEFETIKEPFGPRNKTEEKTAD